MIKEQYEKALGRIINDDYYFPNDIYDEDKASSFEKDVDMLEHLIETHFKLVEKYNDLYDRHLKQVEKLVNEHKDLKLKYSKILDDVHDYRHETHLMKMTIRNLCVHFNCKNEEELKNIYLHKPYKAEDLKAGMYIWDENPDFEEFRIFKIEKILTEKECEYLYHDINKKVFIDNITNHAREFEEGRFFPVTKAMEYQKEVNDDEKY